MSTRGSVSTVKVGIAVLGLAGKITAMHGHTHTLVIVPTRAARGVCPLQQFSTPAQFLFCVGVYMQCVLGVVSPPAHFSWLTPTSNISRGHRRNWEGAKRHLVLSPPPNRAVLKGCCRVSRHS